MHIREGFFGPVKYTVDSKHIREGFFGSVKNPIDL